MNHTPKIILIESILKIERFEVRLNLDGDLENKTEVTVIGGKLYIEENSGQHLSYLDLEKRVKDAKRHLNETKENDPENTDLIERIELFLTHQETNIRLFDAIKQEKQFAHLS